MLTVVERVLRCAFRPFRYSFLEVIPEAEARLIELLGIQGALDCVFDRLLSMGLLHLDQLLALMRLT